MADKTGKFFASDNPERYCMDGEDTPAEAIEAFKAETGEEPSVLGVARAIYVEVDADRLIEDLYEKMGEDLYEDAMDGWCDGVKPEAYQELSTALTKVLHDWLDKHGQDKCWNLIEETEIPEPTECPGCSSHAGHSVKHVPPLCNDNRVRA
jgi:hypothetical protein